MEKLPLPVRKSYVNKRVDWVKRDELICNQVNLSVDDLLHLDSKPIRITLASIGRHINQLALLEKHLDKLPKTKEALNQVAESQDEYQIRRIHWAANQLRLKNEEIVPWKLIRMAGIRPDYSHAISNAIDFAIDFENELLLIGEMVDGTGRYSI